MIVVVWLGRGNVSRLAPQCFLYNGVGGVCVDSVRLYDALHKACEEMRIRGVALSGGLDSTIVAHMIKDHHLPAITVLSHDFDATDTTYCRTAAAATGAKMHLATPSTAELLEYIPETVRIMRCFGEAAIRNALVMYVVISTAKRNDITSLATGDGADELFAGYGFLIRTSHTRLRLELDRLAKIMRFSSHTIGEYLGVRVESPFLHPEVRKIAASLPPFKLVGEYGGVQMGKMILRRLFEGSIPDGIVWRAKSPMQDGAGTSGLKGLLESRISDDVFAERAQAILYQDGIRIRTKESLYYYEQYIKCYDAPEPARAGRTCPDCRCALSPGLRSCRMCGAFPV